jgi:hypothetical protein
MSRTVSDLLEAIRPDEDHLFDTEAVWQRSKRRARQRTVHRRVALAAAAGVAAVAAIAAPTLVLTAGSPSSDPFLPGQSGSVTPSTEMTPPAEPTVSPLPPPDAAPSTRAALSATLRAVSSGNWVIAPAEVGEFIQIAYVRAAGESHTSGSVEVYEPGVFDPAPLLTGTQTTVDGQPAYFGWTENPFSGDESGQYRKVQPTVAWEYAEDAWAVVRFDAPLGTEGIPTDLREIASAVEIGEAVPVLLPFQVGYRPDGLIPVNVLLYDPFDVRRTVQYDYGARHDWSNIYRHLYLPLTISMTPASPQNWQPNTTVGGQPAMRNGDSVIIADGDRWITVGSGQNAAPLSEEDLEQIFADLTLADWTDETTWFDANTAA